MADTGLPSFAGDEVDGKRQCRDGEQEVQPNTPGWPMQVAQTGYAVFTAAARENSSNAAMALAAYISEGPPPM